MNYTYLDNMVIAKECHGDRLHKIFVPGSDPRLAVSVWNLAEIAKHGDKNEAVRRGGLLDAMKPAWLHNGRFIQSDEVWNFLLTRFYNIDALTWSPYANSVSQIMMRDMAAQMPLVGGAAGWVREHHGKLPALDQGDKNVQDAINVRKGKTASERKAAEAETFRQWVTAKIQNLMPVKVPGYGAVTLADLPKLVAYCWDHWAEFYDACPTMAVEDKISEFRALDRGRTARLSDGRDLQHAIESLPYCQHVISGDGYFRSCAEYAQKRLPMFKLATVHATLDDYLRRAEALGRTG